MRRACLCHSENRLDGAIVGVGLNASIYAIILGDSSGFSDTFGRIAREMGGDYGDMQKVGSAATNVRKNGLCRDSPLLLRRPSDPRKGTVPSFVPSGGLDALVSVGRSQSNIQ